MSELERTAFDAVEPFVHEWLDADSMRYAASAPGLAGKRLTADGEFMAHHRSPGRQPVPARSGGTAPGFIFCGDDGDSLWFWPEEEDLAFRFGTDERDRIWRGLPAEVAKLVSQGAMVYCNVAVTAKDGAELVSFSEFPASAA